MGEFTHPEARSEYVGTGLGWNRQLVHAIKAVELPTTALQASDVTWFMYIPAGAVIVDGYVAADDLETATNLAYNIGDSTTTNLFFSTTTTGQSAGSSSMATGARYTKYAAATRIKMTVTTSAGTPVAGTMLVGFTYFVDPEFNVTTGVAPIVVA